MSRDGEIAWAAGLFEGEGSTSFPFPRRALRPGERPQPILGLGSTDLDVLVRFHQVAGFGTLRERTLVAPTRPSAISSRKPYHAWRASGWTNLLWVQENLGPWLGERRNARIAEILEWEPETNVHEVPGYWRILHGQRVWTPPHQRARGHMKGAHG